MDKKILFVIALLVVAGCGKKATVGCQVAADCEGLSPSACTGSWQCVNNFCVWECQDLTGEAATEEVILDISEIEDIEEELDFSELDDLEKELEELDSW